MQKHIYTFAFICVGRYSAHPQKRRLIVIVLIYA